MSGYMYILECCDGMYYVGSTKHLKQRICQHQNKKGAKFTQNRLPVKLVYFEVYQRIELAFYREKQIKRWTRAKKTALINSDLELLKKL